MNTEREWLAALALQYVDNNNISIRKALDKIFGNSQEDTQVIRSTINALVVETIRRKNIIDRLANKVLDQVFQSKQSSYPSLKRLNSRIKSFLRIMIYRLKFENHPIELVLKTANTILTKENESFTESFYLWLSLVNEIHVDQFIAESGDPIEQLALSTWEPYFLVKRFQEVFGEIALPILKYFQTNAPVYIRINSLKDTDVVYEEFKANNVILEKDKYMSDVFKVIESDVPIARLNGFKNGNFYIQSRSSCFISHFLNPQKNESILDTCSAPGSKTTHIASLTKDTSILTALEIDPSRVDILKKTLARSNVHSIKVIQADARDPPFGTDLRFDKILLDAPCSGSGTLSTKTHAKWRIKNPLIKKYSQLQYEILSKISQYLKIGGFLLYSTCSLLPEENEEIISNFLSNNQNFSSIDLPFPDLGQLIEYHGKRLLPHEIDSEGFSVFLLKRIS